MKDILNATSAALAGTRISVDKNFFEQKATEALLAQMRASRRTLKNQLLLNLNKQDVAHYPLDEAFSDLTDYYYAGTLSSALVEVANKAGADAKAAKDQLDATVLTLAQATPDQTATALKLRATYSQIKADLSGTDQAKSDAALARLLLIDAAVGGTPDAAASHEELLAIFAAAMGRAGQNPDRLAGLQAAVTSALNH